MVKHIRRSPFSEMHRFTVLLQLQEMHLSEILVSRLGAQTFA